MKRRLEKKNNTGTDDGAESESIFKKNRAADIEACPTDEGQKTSAQEPENDFFHCAPPHYAKTKERDHRAVWWNKQDCNISVSGKKIKCHI